MLYALLYPLRDVVFAFNVLRYITFRAVLASIIAFLISVIIGPLVISALQKWGVKHSHVRQGFKSISDKSPHKAHVPTMGGILIALSILSANLICGDLSNRYLWIVMGIFLALTVIGFVDDLLKLMNQNSKGLLAMTKLIGQLALGIALGIYLIMDSGSWSQVSIPFLKSVVLPMGIGYVVFVCVVMVGTSNAVNLTDGLDGLAIGCSILIALTYSILSYITGHAVFSEYLYLPYVEGVGELTVFCASMIGAGLGFLWFNSHPASIFMGDTGSLSMGGAIGVIAVLIKKELLLLIVGGIFVVEAISVILQVGSFKLTGKRIFKMAPLHHHFQLIGWSESKIVIRFWILASILSFVGLASLKLR